MPSSIVYMKNMALKLSLFNLCGEEERVEVHHHIPIDISLDVLFVYHTNQLKSRQNDNKRERERCRGKVEIRWSFCIQNNSILRWHRMWCAYHPHRTIPLYPVQIVVAWHPVSDTHAHKLSLACDRCVTTEPFDRPPRHVHNGPRNPNPYRLLQLVLKRKSLHFPRLLLSADRIFSTESQKRRNP